MLGYELVVSAELDGAASSPRGALPPAPPAKPAGPPPPAGSLRSSTTLRVPPGTIPDLRLRVSPILAAPGDKVVAELIRGPAFAGKLPTELELRHLRGRTTQKLDGERKATFELAADTEGWVEITAPGLRALVFVKPRDELAVSVSPNRDRYAPGQTAELAIQTQIAGQGGPAAVGLFGVDASLAQLAPLPGADALARVRPPVETRDPAFGVLDGQALALGRIRGANAAAATVLRVTGIPAPPELEAVISARAETRFDPVEELTDRFYPILAELHVQVRAWEAKAPPDEKMRPATMAALWTNAIAACRARGERVDDAYGRTLRLSRLPDDLLALTDPRAVIVTGTRLPEDVENWPAWVAKEQP
jgi:hypothetical protein